MVWDNGYTVKYSIEVINVICNEPEHYKALDSIAVMNDAKVHYEYGNASRAWHDSVCRVLSDYI